MPMNEMLMVPHYLVCRRSSLSLALRHFLKVLIVAAVCSSSAYSHDMTPLDHISPLISWLRSRGGMFNAKLEIRSADPSNPQQSYLGIFAKTSIKTKEVLIEIPPNCVITAGVPIEHPSAMQCDTIDNLIKEIRLGDDSEFGPYVNYLLSQDSGDLPSAWSDKGKGFLMKVMGEEEQTLPPEEMFEWVDEWEHECNGSMDGLSIKAALLALQRGWDDILIPVYDLMSHRNGKWINTENTPVTFGEVVRVRAMRDIEAGEQLYMSYNFCAECVGRSYNYGTPEILRDYGFVEQYPQRWVFPHVHVTFDLNEIDRDYDGETLTQLELSWVGRKPDKDAKAYFEEELERLSALKLEDEEVPKKEAMITLQFYEALVSALEAALHGTASDELKECSNDFNKCEASLPTYNNLDEEEDDLDYAAYTCLKKDLFKFEGYIHEFESIQSHYQHINFMHHPETKDTCFELDNIVQICGCYRPHYHEMVVHYAARFLPSIKRVVWVGGGDSMLLHEILKYPLLELVVGLELDQVVTRSSFKHFGTQPHWDNPKVQWWYGDAAKSLLMLPHDYFGSFDMVLVDLSETVMSFLVTSELDVMEALSLLLKPEGIFVKNELYLEKLSDIFDYTIQIHYPDVPIICSQALIMASNKVDFIHRELTDHGIDNLFIKQLEEIQYQHEIVHDYVHNNTSAQKYCQGKKNDNKNEPNIQERSPGILMILEAEETMTNFQNLDELQQILKSAIANRQLTVVSATSSRSDENKASTIIIMNEGYIMARTISQFNYCAFDIHLWSSFDKHESVKRAIISAIGSTSVSSYRIVAGGMFGIVTWERDEKSRGPQVTQTCDRPIEPTRDLLVDENTINVIVEESLHFIVEKNYTVMVVCGRDSQTCESVDVVKKNDNVQEVLVLSTCPEIDRSDYKKDISKSMLLCETRLLDKVRKMSKTSKVRAIVIDSTAPFRMGQIIHEIVKQRRPIFSRNLMMMAIMLNNAEEWKRNLLERLRKIIQKEPVFRAEVLLNTTQTSVELGVTSSGDEFFLQRLKNVTKRIETRAKVVSEIRNMVGGLFNYQPNFVPSQFFLPDDYDQSGSLKQWETQQPLGHQSVFQLENEDGKDIVLSTHDLKIALERALSHMEDEAPEMGHFDMIGDGCLIFALWSKGNVVIVWDGRKHIDINLFTYEESKETAETFQKNFKENGDLKNFKTLLYDEQPRGYGRVVNFFKDLNEPRDAPHWS